MDAAADFADPNLAEFVLASRATPDPSARELGTARLRRRARRRAASREPGPELPLVRDVELVSPRRIPCRLYRPSARPLPLVVYLHGGGWTLGDLDTHDRLCRRLARGADAAVLAVHYRRAPRYPWPHAVEDATAALTWATGHLTELAGGESIAVAGDSAGGTLATLACLRLRDEGGPMPDLQALAYPNTDLTFSQPSVREKAVGWGLDADDAMWFAEQWVPDYVMRVRADVSPLLAPDLCGIPPAIVVTAEHDVLRDEGNAYATRMAAAGVPVIQRCEAGLIHGFLGLDTVSPAAANAADRFFTEIRSGLHPVN